jgi:hypothetical protein
MPAEPQPVPLVQVIHRAVEVCDPAGASESLAALLERLEDEDEPVTAVEDVEEVVSEAVNSVGDPDIDPELAMTEAVITYLAHRRDELGEEPVELLRLATRAEFDGKPPPVVADWLTAQGIRW